MSFNLSKFRRIASGLTRKIWEDHGAPEFEEQLQEYNYHKNLMEVTGWDPAIQELSQEYANRAMAKNSKHPEETNLKKMMDAYYPFLDDYSDATRAFLKELRHTYKKVLKALKDDPEGQQKAQNMLQPAVPQMSAQQPVGPGMDMGMDIGPGLAASTKLTKTASHSIFLVKQNGKYLLRDSFIGKLLRGVHQYIGPDGHNMVLDIKDDVSVPRTSAPAKLVFRIQDELPDALLEVVANYLKENGVENEDAPQSIVGPYLENGTLDMRPLSTQIGGASLGFMLYNDVDSIKEPKEVHHLRLSMGKLMDTFLSRLKHALKMRGIKTGERKLKMPSYFRSKGEDEDVLDKYPTRDLGLLSSNKTLHSMDLRSLSMTAASQQSNSQQRTSALDRIIGILTESPKLYKTRPLSSDDTAIMRVMSKCQDDDSVGQRINTLSQLIELFDADDSKILSAYSMADDDLKKHIASMIVSQKRSSVVMTNPDIAKNKSCASCISPSDDQGLSIIKHLVQQHANGSNRLNNPSLKKSMQALYENGDEELLDCCLKTDTPLRDLGLSMMLEYGGPEGKEAAMSTIQSCGQRSETDKILLSVAIMNGSDIESDGASLANKFFNISPKNLSPFIGRKRARDYMCSTRIGWEGGKIPSPKDIHSLTDDPLPLIRDYYDLAKGGEVESKAALHKLYHLISEQLEDNPYMRYSHNFLYDALVDLGEDGNMLGALVSSNIKEPEPKSLRASMLPNGDVIVKQAGVYRVHGTKICFSASPEDAVQVAMTKLVLARD